MRKKSIKELTENLNVNPRYDLRSRDYIEIMSSNSEPFRVVCSAFLYGYLQGSKAAKKEMSVKEREGVYA